MEFHRIDRTSWNRNEHFEHYLHTIPCTYSMTVQLDVTRLLEAVKGKNKSFQAALLYGVAHVINRHKELRMSLDEQGEPGYFDVVHPSYTVFHAETETFSNLWTEYSDDFEIFHAAYLRDLSEYGSDTAFVCKTPVPNLFNFSSLPWVTFTEFHLSLAKGFGYLLPIITVGRYFKQQKKTLLPFAVQLHHAACDGFHASRFVNELQQWISAFDCL